MWVGRKEGGCGGEGGQWEGVVAGQDGWRWEDRRKENVRKGWMEKGGMGEGMMGWMKRE